MEASGRHLGRIWEGGIWKASGRHLEEYWSRNHRKGVIGEESFIEETSGKHLGSIWRHLGDIWKGFGREPSGRHLGDIWGTFGGHLGSIWEASGRHLGGIWEAEAEEASGSHLEGKSHETSLPLRQNAEVPFKFQFHERFLRVTFVCMHIYCNI